MLRGYKIKVRNIDAIATAGFLMSHSMNNPEDRNYVELSTIVISFSYNFLYVFNI
jgi:hypothetical protein